LHYLQTQVSSFFFQGVHMKTMLTFTSLALAGILATASAARAQRAQDIVDTAVAAGSFTTLAKALTAADLVTTLRGRARSRSLRHPTRRLQSCPPARWTLC
jgi:hypothetical protein